LLRGLVEENPANVVQELDRAGKVILGQRLVQSPLPLVEDGLLLVHLERVEQSALGAVHEIQRGDAVVLAQRVLDSLGPTLQDLLLPLLLFVLALPEELFAHIVQALQGLGKLIACEQLLEAIGPFPLNGLLAAFLFRGWEDLRRRGLQLVQRGNPLFLVEQLLEGLGPAAAHVLPQVVHALDELHELRGVLGLGEPLGRLAMPRLVVGKPAEDAIFPVLLDQPVELLGGEVALGAGQELRGRGELPVFNEGQEGLLRRLWEEPG